MIYYYQGLYMGDFFVLFVLLTYLFEYMLQIEYMLHLYVSVGVYIYKCL